MRIFISWSGDTSHEVAKILYDWLLKMNIPALELFISDKIGKGYRWFDKLTNKLATADGGIFCLTKENVNAPWLSFEAGALCVTQQEPLIFPVLFGVEPSDITEPFKAFEYTAFTRDDVEALVFELKRPWNERDAPPDHLETDFKRLYPELEAKVEKLKADMESAGEH